MAVPESDDLQRDKLLSRLLAESLAAPAANDEACPDAETIAAYADQGLPNYVVAQLDEHFASCARCQQVLVALALTSDELPARVAALRPQSQAALLPFQTQRAKPRFAQTHWRWLTTAAAIAAAVAIWFALRPAPPIQTLSAKNEAPSVQSPSAPHDASAESNLQNDSQDKLNIAKSNIPAPPPPVPAPAAAPAPVKESAQELREFSADTLKKTESAKQTESSDKPATPVDSSGAGALAVTSLPQVETTNATLAPASSGQPPASDSPISVGSSARAKSAQANSGTAIVSALARPLAVAPPRTAIFAAPGGAALWRIGPAGSIERSTDQGRTWEKQASGVAGDLTAGVAISNVSAWIVGRSGVILRTADGISWQPIPFSPGATGGTTPDFTGIDARDALHATLTTADGHHFATQDGGQTWTAQ